MRNLSLMVRQLGWLLLLLVLLLFHASLRVNAQVGILASKPPEIQEKADKVLQRAIQQMGGSRYLSVKTVVGTGNFSQYADGQLGTFFSFVDYVIYPDMERTEFKAQGVRTIQTNVRDTGWVYDGAAATIRVMKKEQIDDFQLFALRTSLENLLRGFWRTSSGVALKHAGRREAGIGRRSEVVRLSYADGFEVEFEFSEQTGLPIKALYSRQNSEGVMVKEEDRYAQFLDDNGITSPYVIDHFRAGAQTSRINYKSIEFNRPLADTLFARPTNAKDVK